MDCVLVTSDLMWTSRFTEVCRAKGYDCAVTSPREPAKITNGRVVLLDLAALASDQLADVVQEIRNVATSPCAIVAFASHVHAAKLEAARRAGCERVMTRGQIHSQLAEVLEQLLVA